VYIPRLGSLAKNPDPPGLASETTRALYQWTTMDSLEQLRKIELGGVYWRGMYYLAMQRVRRRDRAFAEAVLAESLEIAQKTKDLEALVRAKGPDRWFEKVIAPKLKERLNRGGKETLRDLHEVYLRLCILLMDLPNTEWPSSAQKYWQLVWGKRPAKVPKAIETVIRQELSRTRAIRTARARSGAARTAALQILYVMRDHDPEALRQQFYRAGFKL
jgi:hypothetical protein